MDSPFVHWYHNQTNVHPMAIVAFTILATMMLVVSRRFAYLPLLLLASLVPSAQRIVVADLDFTFLRLMVIVGFLRVAMRSEVRGFRWTGLDYALVALILTTSAVSVIRRPTSDALILNLGVSFDAIGLYMLARLLLRSWRDLDRLALSAILVSIITAAFFLVELQTGRNVFAVFGGVSEITTVREGRMRCMGAFGNAILAGCFWASLMPLMGARAFQSRNGAGLSVIGVVCATIIVFASGSSTPLMGVAMGVVALGFIPLRYSLRPVRWGLAATLVLLHIVMKAPVWHLIARIDLVGGSTGYHRYKLIDAFVNRFREWALVGVNSTAHWGWGMVDVANQYVAYGVRGGLLGFILFIAVLSLAFRQNGIVLRRVTGSRGRTAYAWALGMTLFMHACMFLAVSYFGQIQMIFYGTLGAIGSMTAATEAARAPIRGRSQGSKEAAAPGPNIALATPGLRSLAQGLRNREMAGRSD
jgi:hypothetical protein